MATAINVGDAFDDDTRPNEQELGRLAMRYRGTTEPNERRAIVEDYARVIDRLVEMGSWHDVPAPEDQLPDECMPPLFFEYWSQRG